MKQIEKIPEIDVLIATVLWLKDRGATPLQLSVAKGQGIDSQADTKRLREALSDADLPEPNLEKTGQDVIALSNTEFWQVECKGTGEGKPSTQRNNFDRALASTVSYFKEMPEEVEVQSRLGLALPATPAYLKELQRVGKPLRKRLDLWVLLLNPHNKKSIRAVSPDEEIPDN